MLLFPDAFGAASPEISAINPPAQVVTVSHTSTIILTAQTGLIYAKEIQTMRSFMKKMCRVNGRSCHPFLFLVIFVGSVLQVCAQQDDKRIEEIRRLSRQVNEQIAESESSVESTGVYCNELVVNKGDKSWPAVGIYRMVFKFYYTFGDREKDPYPNRLLKITVMTDRSTRHEYAEYLFNPAGQLIFYFEKDDESSLAERRYYFASERLIRRMTGQRVVDINSREAVEAAKGALNEKKKLREIFLKSLGN